MSLQIVVRATQPEHQCQLLRDPHLRMCLRDCACACAVAVAVGKYAAGIAMLGIVVVGM